MKRWGVVLGVLWGTMLVWAAEEVAVIYRKADRLVVGSVMPPHSIEVEIDNIVKSQLGGTKDDYAVVFAPHKGRGERYVVNADGIVSTAPYPDADEPVEIPLGDFGAGAAGALAALAGQRLVILARRKKGSN